jgi:hypothetical protein
MRLTRTGVFVMAGERRLPACSVRQLAERMFCTWPRKLEKQLAAGCRQLQAGSLCSPEGERSVNKTRWCGWLPIALGDIFSCDLTAARKIAALERSQRARAKTKSSPTLSFLFLDAG